jgi:hypothetical protein
MIFDDEVEYVQSLHIPIRPPVLALEPRPDVFGDDRSFTPKKLGHLRLGERHCVLLQADIRTIRRLVEDDLTTAIYRALRDKFPRFAFK